MNWYQKQRRLERKLFDELGPQGQAGCGATLFLAILAILALVALGVGIAKMIIPATVGP